MSSPPTHNIHLDPLSELTKALESHKFGLTSYQVLRETSFPRTREEKASVAQQARDHGGQVPAGVVAHARVVLLDTEGEVEVCLDARGYTIENTTSTHKLDQKIYESLDALFIALSPAYVAAMQSELMKRFEGGPTRRFNYSDDEDGCAEEPAWVD